MNNLEKLGVTVEDINSYFSVRIYSFSSDGIVADGIEIDEAINAIKADAKKLGITGIFAFLYVENEERLQTVSLDDGVLDQESVRSFIRGYRSFGGHPEIVKNSKTFLTACRNEFRERGLDMWIYSSADLELIAEVERGRFRKLCVSNRELPNLTKLLKACGVKL